MRESTHQGRPSPTDGASASISLTAIWIPQVVATAMLLWALNPDNKYGYYVLLRWVCCGVFTFLAVQAADRDKSGMAWILGVTALIYNPILRVHLNRELWSLVNLVTIGIAIASIYSLRQVKTVNPA